MTNLKNINPERYIDEFKIRILDLGKNAKDVSLYAPMKREPVLRYMILKNTKGYNIVEIRDNRLFHEDGIKLSGLDLKIYLCNEVHNRLI